MARNRSPNREKAFEIYKEHHGNISAKAIANILCEKERNVTLWKKKDRWKQKYNPKGGAPRGNQNAIGNKGGAPKGNQHNRKHGFYSELLPKETYNIFEDVEDMDPLEIIWTNIKIKFAAILRAQKIMYVKDQNDTTKELKKTKIQNEDINGDIVEIYREEEFEIQFAWDKQATFLNAQSRAMSQLMSMIKKYDDMLHQNWDMATEEQKLRVAKLKAQLDNKEFNHKKEVTDKKMQLERERFEHTKKMDESKVW